MSPVSNQTPKFDDSMTPVNEKWSRNHDTELASQKKQVSFAESEGKPKIQSFFSSEEKQSTGRQKTDMGSEAERQDISNDDQITENTTQAAAGVYLELKRCLKEKDVKKFKSVLEEGLLFCPKIGCTPETLIAELASHQDSEGANLLHNAA